MPRARKTRRKPPVEFLDLVGRVTRTALAYGINNHHLRWETPHPNSRRLHLYGVVALPEALAGLALEVALSGGRPQPDAPEPPLRESVAHLRKLSDRISVFAEVPPDFIPALSAGFHDGRLQLFWGRGPKLFRNETLLRSIDFEDLAQFEENWGEPLPEVALRVPAVPDA